MNKTHPDAYCIIPVYDDKTQEVAGFVRFEVVDTVSRADYGYRPIMEVMQEVRKWMGDDRSLVDFVASRPAGSFAMFRPSGTDDEQPLLDPGILERISIGRPIPKPIVAKTSKPNPWQFRLIDAFKWLCGKETRGDLLIMKDDLGRDLLEMKDEGRGRLFCQVALTARTIFIVLVPTFVGWLVGLVRPIKKLLK